MHRTLLFIALLFLIDVILIFTIFSNTCYSPLFSLSSLFLAHLILFFFPISLVTKGLLSLPQQYKSELILSFFIFSWWSINTWSIVALAEFVAINYKAESNSLENCFHWYDVIVTLTNRHGNYFETLIEISFLFIKGIGISAPCNDIKCSLQFPYPVGYQTANFLFHMRSDWNGDKCLPLRLEIAEQLYSLEILTELEICYQQKIGF